MNMYEYKVVPAPAKGQKARGVRKAEDKFAYALEELMNNFAQDGWEFQRSETLPNEERTGLTSTATTFRSVMVFRRLLKAADTQPAPVEALPEPEPPKPLPAPKMVEAEPEDTFFDAQELIPPAQSPSTLPAALRQRAGLNAAKKDIAAE